MENILNTLKTGDVEIVVAKRGAELKNYKVKGEEFICNSNPDFCAGSSTYIFPFVVNLKN